MLTHDVSATTAGQPGRDQILVVGEAVLDRVRISPLLWQETPGGSPANVAIGLARLAHPVRFLTQLGDDPAGQMLRSHLIAAGVRIEAQPTPSGRTSSADAVVDERGAATYAFDLDFALSDHPVDLTGIAHLHLGSVSAILGPAWTRVRDLALGRPAGTLASYDVNLRPALTGADPGVRRRVLALAGAVDLVKASDEDLAALWPDDSPTEAARRLLHTGGRGVVVTLGSAGSLLVTQAGLSLTRPAVSATVVDTIGAGDSFMAGLIHALVGADLGALGTSGWSTALDRAARNAAYTVGHAGAAMPSPAEVGEA